MASKILTEQEVYNIGKKGTATANLLCTYARAEALGCTVASGYSLESNQLVYEGSVKQKVTTCTYTIHSVSNDTQAYCDGTTHTIVTYSVSGAVTASNQTHGVSQQVASCSSSICSHVPASASFTHSGCSNSRTVTWSATAKNCNLSCTSCLSISTQSYQPVVTNICGKYISFYFYPSATTTSAAGPVNISPYASYTLPPGGRLSNCHFY